MPRHLPSRKTLALTLAGLAVTYLLFAWLALPRIIQSQAEKFFAGKAGHRLTMDRPEFNPFRNSLRLSGLRLVKPDGEPLLAFRELVVDMSVASLFRRAFVFDDIRLDGLETTILTQPDGRNNWSALIGALQGTDEKKNEKPKSSLPRVDIQRFALSGARLDITDMWAEPVFATRIEPINLELTDISTLPDDKGRFNVTARTVYGASVAWQGRVSLEPPDMAGSIKVENVDISRLATYIKDVLPIDPPAGIFGASADYRFAYSAGRPQLNVEHMTAKLTGLRLQGNRDSHPSVAADSIAAEDGRFDLQQNRFTLGNLSVTGGRLDLERGNGSGQKALELGSLSLDDVRVDLAARLATLGTVALKDGSVRVTRDAMGRIDILQALQAGSSPAGKQETQKKSAGAPADTGWHYRVEKLALSKFGAALRDETVTPAADLALEDIALGADGISDDWKAPVPLRASFKARDGGSFEAKGNVVPDGPTADIQLKLTALNLAPAQPYLSGLAKLKLVQGQLSSAGRARYGSKGASYRGNFAVRDLRLNEAESGNPFLSWKSLGSRAIEVTPAKLDIGELKLSGLDTKLVINKDKSVSIKRILLHPEATAAPKPAEAPPAATEKTHPFLVNIDRLKIDHSGMDFADYSLTLPFGTRIHDLHGVVTGLSSKPGAPGQVELDGQVDEYGLARAVGQVDLFNPTDFMDLKVVFRNIEMTRLTPYSATFAGRRINSGKLSLDLEYKIKQRKLQGENQVVMDQLTLGERVESPDATNLPLDFAIAILQDSDGRIDLGLPVSGSLDDPQFSYGRIIWKAIVNVLTKIVTAPFRALGALFGGGEKFEDIAFEAGDAQLTPPEREKLARLAGILAKRPGLSLTLQGAYAETDRVALQDLQLRRAVAEQNGLQVEADSDPGPISTRQPKVQSALEKLYADRFGSTELAALKQGFRQANPGQMEESTAGKLISRLTGLFREKRKLNEQEVSQLKGADFYSVLYERLRNAIAVGDDRLQALAAARGEFAVAALKAAGVPAERLALQAPAKVDVAAQEVPLKLTLGATAKNPVPVASGVGAK